MGSRQLPEFGATLMVRICAAITGHRIRPLQDRTASRARLPMLARQLGVPVRVTGRTRRSSWTPRSLAVPVVNADARLLDLLRRYADEVLARRAGKDDLVAHAERWILETSIPARSASHGWPAASA